MCGLLVHVDPSASWHHPSKAFMAGLATLQTRGPDALEAFQFGHVTMGHALLSITGAARASCVQPLSDDTFCLVFNGEIYNFLDLKRQLLSEGINVPGQSDTEVLFAGLKAKGLDFLGDVIGTWALAWLDQTNGQLTFCRDPNGEKQLVYRFEDGLLSLSSEAKACFPLIGAHPGANTKRFLADLVFGFMADRSATYFDGIHNVEPGTIYTLNLGTNQLVKRPCRSRDLSGAPRDDLRTALHRAVDIMCPYDRKYGLVLSGGLDSSIIGGILNEIGHGTVPALTIKYDQVHNPDLECARQLCSTSDQLEHHVLEVTGSDFLQQFKKVQDHLEEPLYDQVYVAQYMIYRWFRQNGLDVALNGQASDEFWRGYQQHFLLDEIDTAEQNGDPAAFFLERAKTDGLGTLYSTADIKACIEQELAAVQQKQKDVPLADALCTERHLQAMMSHEDRLSMASGVEVRIPFLYPDIIRHALRTTREEKLFNGMEKYPLRNAVKGIVPESIRLRRKKAFPDAPKSYYDNVDNAFMNLGANSLYNARDLRKATGKLRWNMTAQNAFNAACPKSKCVV